MRDTLAFGPYVLIPDERLLLRDGVPVEIGGRAFDLLAALVAHPDEVVSKADLLARVWPDVIVEEGSLRFHVALLRKILNCDGSGTRYIVTLTGRGYRSVAPVARSDGRADPHDGPVWHHPRFTLPSRPIRIIGLDDDVAAVVAQLRAARFVTLVGTGGVGKTTVAVAAGHGLVRSFDGAVHMVDLGALNDPDLVATTVTSMLGLTFGSGEAVRALSAFLGQRPSCLILDTCEHVVDGAARLGRLCKPG